MNYKNFFTLLLLTLSFGLIHFWFAPSIALAQDTNSPLETFTESLEGLTSPASTAAGEATTSGKLASASAETEQKIKEKQAEDLTETAGEKKSKLAAYLDEHPIGPISWHNPLQHAIRRSIENGLPANIIVLLILFPVIVSVIAASRHFAGLKGFGIYIPAVLAVAFVSTGIPTGVIVFVAVLIATILGRKIIRQLKLPHLPRTAMLLWGVSIFILLLLMASTFFEAFSLLTINIFPLLIIILLTENFMESQLFTSQKEALRLTLETLFIAIICSFFINLDQVQQIILLRPELTLILVALINFILGKYTGLRLLEYFRFQSILDKTS